MGKVDTMIVLLVLIVLILIFREELVGFCAEFMRRFMFKI